MSPIDDELRAALQGRAATVSPAPDPLAGIERRAHRMRRTRAAGAVAASALAVAAIAVAVPALSPAAAPAPITPAVTSSATPETVRPDTVAPPSPFLLDPGSPWAARGLPVDGGTRATIQREYATLTQGFEVLVTPLFAQVYEPSGQLEVVFLAEVDGALRWGVAQSSEAGPEFLWDERVPTPTFALAAALPGDELPRLLVVTAPGTDAEYGPDTASEFAPMTELVDGVALTALDGDTGSDVVRVVGLPPGEDEIARLDAPDPVGGSDQPADSGDPDNLLDWPSRGDRSAGPTDEQVLLPFAQSVTGTVDPEARTSYRALFSGSTDAGVRFTYGQAWVDGQPAQTVGLATGGTEGDQFFLGPVTPAAPSVLAFVLCCQPGSSVDTLVVVPEPGTGQVRYDDDATGALRPVGAGQDFLDGVVLVDRDPRAQADRLQLFDGNGDLDRPTFEGPVFDLLCGLTSCG